ncbi:MAG: carboxypeptidase-like regulatory domain-containing protein, partial [Ginsengibacter sp.]
MKLILFFLTLISFYSASAQIHVSGTIYDHKSNPLSGISISLKDTYDGATTDSLGQFSFTSTEKGNQLLVVTSAEYKPFEKPINLDSGSININVT